MPKKNEKSNFWKDLFKQNLADKKQNEEKNLKNTVKKAEPVFTIKNKTAKRIGIECKDLDGDKQVIVIPPFGSKNVSEDVISQNNCKEWRNSGLIDVKQQKLEDDRSEESIFSSFLYLWLLIGLFLKGPISNGFGFEHLTWAKWTLYFVIAGIFALGSFKGLRETLKSLNVLIFFVIGVLMPCLIVYFFGGIEDYFSQDTAPLNNLVHIQNLNDYKDKKTGKLSLIIGPRKEENTGINIEVIVNENFKIIEQNKTLIKFEQIDPDKEKNCLVLVVNEDNKDSPLYYYPLSSSELNTEDRIEFQKKDPFLKDRLYQKGFQLIFGIIFVLLPGMFFFQFEKRKVGTLRERFFREIMLLNPSILTRDDAKIIYGDFIDEVGGLAGEKQRQYSLLTCARPILIATILISLGWLFTLLPTGEFDTNVEIYEIIAPTSSSIGFAFLGAYLFTINFLLRRYFRGDLNPKAYSHITVRILTSIILAWVLDIVIPGTTLDPSIIFKYSFVFLVGIFPEAGVAYLIESIKKRTGSVFDRGLEKENPITKLGGVSIYDRARLLEEGVENIENMAHCNLIELMIRTRIPTSRLVDLVDQAILFIHVYDENDLKILKENGIRTATDLVLVNKQDKEKNGENLLLNLLGQKTENMPQKLKIILDSLEDDEWLQYIKFWRLQSESVTKIVTKLDWFFPKIFDDRNKVRI